MKDSNFFSGHNSKILHWFLVLKSFNYRWVGWGACHNMGLLFVVTCPSQRRALFQEFILRVCATGTQTPGRRPRRPVTLDGAAKEVILSHGSMVNKPEIVRGGLSSGPSKMQ